LLVPLLKKFILALFTDIECTPTSHHISGLNSYNATYDGEFIDPFAKYNLIGICATSIFVFLFY